MYLHNIGSEDFERSVWRYMPFAKFISLLTYRALWFSKLNILQDAYEGLIPAKVKARMHASNQRFKGEFNTPEFHRQIDAWPTENEAGGRELLVVTCWFLGECDSQRMWDEYGVTKEAVAVKSTIGRLAKYIFVPRGRTVSALGPTTYVDHDIHDMSLYEAHQATQRAFLKGNSYSHEQEIRLVTLNVKTTSCVSPSGRPYRPEEVEGAKMNNFDGAGLYIGVNLDCLIAEVVVCPSAEDWFNKLVSRVVELAGLKIPVSRSQL